MDEENRPIRLIMVDDEVDFLKTTAGVLMRRGFDVTSVQNGAVALQVIENEEFDVAVLDERMPGLSGEELFRAIRERKPHLPVILLTGHGSIQQAFRTSREGVFEYLTKPCKMEKLVQTLRQAVISTRQSDFPDAKPLEPDDVRILIVDDEKDFLESMSSVLRRRGMRVSTASGGNQALEKLGMLHFDVILLDLKMPGINGNQLLPLIRKAHPTSEIILLTGHPSIDGVVDGLKDGAFDYLIKPQDTIALVNKIQQACRKSRLRANEAKRRELGQILQRHPD